MTLLLAFLSGTGLGYALERGDLCFHSTLRGLFRKPQQLDLFRAYVIILLVATPSVSAMRALGWIDPWIPPFAWGANLFGGLIFGVGMVAASSCITGLFYKLGHGMLGTLIGLGTWAVGDLLVYLGPLSSLRERLTASAITVEGNGATLGNTLGPVGIALAIALGLAGVFWLWRSPTKARDQRGKLWGWLPLGITVGLVIAVSWLLADWGGTDYPYGTSYVPTGTYLALSQGDAQGTPWIPVALAGLIPGALLAAWRGGTLWVRGETLKRYVELGVGGFLMGVGAAFAGGCNLGHSMVGVPLLSLGSITTTLAMITGVFVAHQVIQLTTSQRTMEASYGD
jgi:uncharacterized membrane protein YedE/YeeE